MKMIVVIVFTAIWTVAGASTYAKNIDNHVSILAPGYVHPIEGRGFLPGAQTTSSYFTQGGSHVSHVI